MKAGDLIKLDPELYIREKNDTGILVERAPVKLHWVVMIRGRIHPYYIDEEDMVVINESE